MHAPSSSHIHDVATPSISAYAEALHLDSVTTRLCFDAEEQTPNLIAALAHRCPSIRDVMAELRQRIPLAPHSAPGAWGQFYRLKSHYRSVCCALPINSSPLSTNSEVIVFKGSEPLLKDFHNYLQWMLTAHFRNSDLPLGLHLPFVLRMPPGAMPIDECQREQRITSAFQQRHLDCYGELAQVPVPLLVHEYAGSDVARYVDTVRRNLPTAAFERVEARAKAGLGIEIYYYPSSPVRVENVHRAGVPLVVDVDSAEDTIKRWATLAARLLALRLMPYVTWNRAWGSCLDFGNACLDGGLCDLLTLTPFESIGNNRLFRSCLRDTFSVFAETVCLFCKTLSGTRQNESDSSTIDPLCVSFARSILVDSLQREGSHVGGMDERVTAFVSERSVAGLIEALREPTYSRAPYSSVAFDASVSHYPAYRSGTSES
jgi:hypothetical protein